MAYISENERILMRVICTNVQKSAVKKQLEQIGVIYAEDSEEITFSIMPMSMPMLREEDKNRAIQILRSQSHA